MTQKEYETQYFKGFNEGYMMAKYEPALADRIANVKSATPRMEGFIDGKDQYILDRARDLTPEWLGADKADNNLDQPDINTLPDRDTDKDINP